LKLTCLLEWVGCDFFVQYEPGFYVGDLNRIACFKRRFKFETDPAVPWQAPMAKFFNLPVTQDLRRRIAV
jgi:hypothetical protein